MFNNRDQSDFNEKSRRERYALRQIIPLHFKDNPKYDKDIQYSIIESGSKWDAIVTYSIDGSVVKRYIIECKIRTKHHSDDDDGMIIGKQKYKDLKKVVWDDITQIVFVCVSPLGSYIFNLSQLEAQDKLISKTIFARKYSSIPEGPDNPRINKYNWAMISSLCINHFDWVWDEEGYKQTITQIVKENNMEKVKHDLYFDLFDEGYRNDVYYIRRKYK